MTLLSEINSPEWAISVQGFGEIVEGDADLDQSIQLIWSTMIGSDPLRPLFGSKVWTHLDKPANIAGPEIVRDGLQAIATWETRVKVTNIQYRPVQAGMEFIIKYTRTGSNTEGTARIAIQQA